MSKLGSTKAVSGRTLLTRRVLYPTALVLMVAAIAFAQRSKLRPGWNIFSTQQDIEMGKEVSKEAEQKLQMLNDRRVDDYLNRLGKRLAEKAPGAKYPYQFKGVNDLSINAFALPGGYLYVHRGIIENADNEAQLAGVMGHEIGHVALRHGTNQATKAYAAQVPLAVLGGVVGSNSIVGVLTQLGAGFAANSVLLKYGRDAERQADLIGTQILFDSGYNPVAMAQFFEKLEGESKQRSLEFFASHPNPENRIKGINVEIGKLGAAPPATNNDSAEFREIRKYVKTLPQPAKAPAAQQEATATPAKTGPPERPATSFQDYQDNSVRLRHPSNWRAYGQERALTIAPDGGIVKTSANASALAYGMMMGVFEPRKDRRGQITIQDATSQLIASLQESNPQMKISRNSERAKVGDQTGLSTLLTNQGPNGGNETNWLVTALQTDGLVYLVFVAPESEYSGYQAAFQGILNSLQFKAR